MKQILITFTLLLFSFISSTDIASADDAVATLPFYFDKGKSNLSTGMTQKGLGTDNASSPKLKFDTDEDYLIIHFEKVESPYLQFFMKGSSFNSGQFDILESADGTLYTTVRSLTRYGDGQLLKELNTNTTYVKFVFTKKDGTVSIGKISIWDADAIKISPVGYSTYYDSKHAYVMPDDCVGYTATYNEKFALNKTYDAKSVVPAGEPLVIKTSTPGTKSLVYTTTTQTNCKSQGTNILDGTDEATALTVDTDSYFYALSRNAKKENNSVGFYWINDDGAAFTNGAHKAYLKLAKSNFSSTEAKSGFVFEEEEIATVIGDTKVATPVCDSDGSAYNIVGQRVNANQNGIVIVNGRKYINK